MSGFYITPIRLQALDFPGQVALFTNLKTPVYFRNATLDWITYGGWADLPASHFSAFMKALDEGWVWGERQWHVDSVQFTRRWTTSWVRSEGFTSVKINPYVERCKVLIDKGVYRPFVNDPDLIPVGLLTYIVETLEANTQEADLYSVVNVNLEKYPNPPIAHRTFKLLFKKLSEDGYRVRYSHMDIIDDLSRMNSTDRKTFLSWLFKSPEHLQRAKDENYDIRDIVLKAVESGEVWYVEKPDENQRAVPKDTRSQESTTEILSTSQQS